MFDTVASSSSSYLLSPLLLTATKINNKLLMLVTFFSVSSLRIKFVCFLLGGKNCFLFNLLQLF